jgi:DNA repair protein RadC
MELRRAYRTVEQKLRELAGGPLDPLLAACGEAQADYPDPAQFGDDPPLRRLLARLGLIRRSRSAANLYECVRRMAEATGERIATVRRVLQLYCAPAEGIPAVVCGEEPACGECPLAPECRHFQRAPSIKDLPEDQRPRERLIAGGERALSDAELLAIILRSGTEEQTAIGLAQSLLAKFGTFRALAGRSIAELRKVKGVGPAKAAQVKAALEIGRRIASEAAAGPGRHITDSQAVYDLCWPSLRDQKKETFLALLLDARNRFLREVEVSVGSLTASLAHPREVFGEAVRDAAAAVICVHNHPAGDPAPSPRDVEITNKLHATGKILGIALLDHVILGEGCHYSFADDGKLPHDGRQDG